MRASRTRLSWLAGALALVLAWLITRAAVPLYDGVGIPDEPYRFVHPPPGYRTTAPPTSAAGRVPAADGSSRGAIDIYSNEVAPQVEVYIAETALTGSRSARWLDVHADPLAPGRASPAMPINGNLYRVRAGSDPVGPVTVNTKNPDLSIALRATTVRSIPATMLYRPSPAARWRTLRTEKTGTDTFASAFAGLGDYALSYLPSTARAARHTAKQRYSPRFLVIMSLLLAILLAIAAIRAHRSQQS